MVGCAAAGRAAAAGCALAAAAVAAEAVLALVAGLARPSSNDGGCGDEEAGPTVYSGRWQRAVGWHEGGREQRQQQGG